MQEALKPRGAAHITFAIPFYTGRQYLQKAIDSVRKQTCSNWQLLICDDQGPEPEIEKLVRSYKDSRIGYHRNQHNLGMAGNWNRCLDLAETDLVTLLHADDELLENYAEMMLAAAAKYPRAVAFFCAARIIDEHSRRRSSFPDWVKGFLMPAGRGPLVLEGRGALESLLLGDYIMCPTVCYRRNILGSRRFATRWRMVQDYELFTRLLLEGETLVGLREEAYAYRRHAGNATTAYTESLLRFQEESALYDELERAAAEHGWTRAARRARGKSILKLNLLYCSFRDLGAFRARQAWQKLRLLGRLITGGGGSPNRR